MKKHQMHSQILIVVLFISNFYSVNAENHKYSKLPSEMKEAIEMNDTNAVKRLINDGYDINKSTGEIDETLLFLAAVCRRPDMVNLLLELGANPCAINKWGETPFHRAVAFGNMNVAEILLEKGAKYDVKDSLGITPLYVAAKEGREEMAIWLLKLGADPNITAKNYPESILFHAAYRDEHKLIKALIDSGARIEGKDPRGKTPLHMLVFHGDLENIELLIKKGVDVNAADNNGQTPLHFSAFLGKGDQAAVIDLLVSKGAYVNKKDKFGRTPLDMLSARKDMNKRIESGSDKEKEDLEKTTNKIEERLRYYMNEGH